MQKFKNPRKKFVLDIIHNYSNVLIHLMSLSYTLLNSLSTASLCNRATVFQFRLSIAKSRLSLKFALSNNTSSFIIHFSTIFFNLKMPKKYLRASSSFFHVWWTLHKFILASDFMFCEHLTHFTENSLFGWQRTISIYLQFFLFEFNWNQFERI